MSETKGVTKLPVFEDRPYGGRLKLDSSRTLIVLAQHANTAAGIDKERLDKDGLRGHENEATEQISFLRFADDAADDHSTPLVYRFRDQDGQVQEKRFGVGSEFFSVNDEGKTGFWHVIENGSSRPILFMVTATEKTAALRQ